MVWLVHEQSGLVTGGWVGFWFLVSASLPTNLVGRKVKDGNDKGVIFRYERNGPFHWWVRFDDEDRDDEAMNLDEIKKMLI